jgi:HEXXH motif-containing protein
MVDVLIHEAAHLYLYNLGVDDALVLNEYEDKFFSPIKSKDRPMLGVYHAAFVLSRVVQFLRLLGDTTLCTPTELIETHILIEKYTKMASDSFKIVQEYGILTPLGKQMMHSAEKEMNLAEIC